MFRRVVTVVCADTLLAAEPLRIVEVDESTRPHDSVLRRDGVGPEVQFLVTVRTLAQCRRCFVVVKVIVVDVH